MTRKERAIQAASFRASIVPKFVSAWSKGGRIAAQALLSQLIRTEPQRASEFRRVFGNVVEAATKRHFHLKKA